MIVPMPARPAVPRARAGGAAAAALYWILGLTLFALPFLREPQAPDPDSDLNRSEQDLAFEEDVASFEAEFQLPLGEHVARASEEWFGPGSSRLAGSGLVELWRLDSGAKVYALQCAGCHGRNGDGAGPASPLLQPRPRNFRKGVFKFTSTESGGKPLRRDLFSTITRGLAGASMPEFRLLPEEQRWNVVEYVRWLSMKGEFERLVLESAWEDEELPDPEELGEIVYERWSEPRARVVWPGASEPPRSAEGIERGREIFVDRAAANCAACHGESGRGDGPTADEYLDDWGYPIRPRDFTAGVFRAGETGADLYRTIAVGIQGTPMGAFGSTIAAEDIWHLVHYVQSLAEGGSASR
jgi:mono/diheme cytochrome c family protein